MNVNNIKIFQKIKEKIKEIRYNNKCKFINKRNIIICLSILALFVVTYNMYISFNIAISYDSSKYHNYSEIFMGNRSLSTWDVERGFSFPLVIYLCRIIFGSNSMAFVKGFFIFYFIMLLIIIKIIYDLIKYNNIKKKKIMYYILFLCLFPFNPLIVGWGHYMLTEAVVPCMYFIAVYLSMVWFGIDFKNSKLKFIIILFFFSLISIFVWFLKQPYAPTIWAMIGITAIASSIHFAKIRVFFEKILGLIVVVLVNIIAIFVWNMVLKNADVDFENARDNTFFLQNNIIEGIYYHVKGVPENIKCSEDYIKSMKLQEKRKKNIYNLIKHNENWCSYLSVYEVRDKNDKLIAHEYFISDDGKPSLKDVVIFVSKLYVRYPKLQFDTLISSYLSLIDIHETAHNYKATGIYSGVAIKELGVAFHALSYNNNNTWWQENNGEDDWYLTEETLKWIKPMKNYEGVTSKSEFMSNTMMLFEGFSLFLFKILLLFCLPIGLYALIMFIRYPKSKCYFMIMLLSLSSFVHLMFHVFMGAIIDRYAYPVYPLMLLCMILLFLQNNDSDEFKKEIIYDRSILKNEKNKKRRKAN